MIRSVATGADNMRNDAHDRTRWDAIAMVRLLGLLCLGALLTAGFAYAANQHFVALKLGYQMEVLRLERSKLIEEKQRLLLAREQVATPARLEAAALKLGLRPVSALQVAAAARMQTQSLEHMDSMVKREADTRREQNGHAQIVRSGQQPERSATRR